jgi:SP family sugar:H+ symporter-like MFS transporter
LACHLDRVVRSIWWCSVWVSQHSFSALVCRTLILAINRYDTGTISGILAMKYWDREFSTGYKDSDGNLNITASQSATIVSILSAGTFFGALTAAPIADAIGRRFGLISSTLIFIFGVVLQTAATAIPLFAAGRFFAGFGVGLISAMSK